MFSPFLAGRPAMQVGSVSSADAASTSRDKADGSDRAKTPILQLSATLPAAAAKSEAFPVALTSEAST